MSAEVYTYRWIYRILYKYANILATILLLLYLLPALFSFDGRITDYLYILMIVGGIYLINRHFIKLYKIVPYRIEIIGDTIHCSQYAFSRKKVELRFSDIDKLEGGIFEGKSSGLMKLHTTSRNLTIGFFIKISGAKALESVVLAKVNKDLYHKVLDSLGIDRTKLKKKE